MNTKLKVVFSLYLSALILGLMLNSCATAPKGATQTVYAAGWTLVGATNSVADLHQSGVLKGQDYEKAKAVLMQAEAAYKDARAATAQGKPADAQSYILLTQQLLNQLAAYLQAHGGN